MLIKKGQKNDAVRKIRGLMQMVGYYDVDSGNNFNGFLEDKIKDFQEKAHLEADGMVGDKTYAYMNKAYWLEITEFDLMTSNGSNLNVNTVFEPNEYIFSYNRERLGADQVGTKPTIDALYTLGKMWHEKYPEYPKPQVGDISRKHGGYFSPHISHQNGQDVDFRPMRTDSAMLPVEYTSDNYSFERTKALVLTLLEILPKSGILFNDPAIIALNRQRIRRSSGHHNHLHWDARQ